MAKKLEILIVCANFYEEITDNLLEGVKNALKGEKVTYEIITVPGALEIAPAIKRANEVAKFDGYIALGCIIRGETYHFEVVSNESARALTDLAIHHNIMSGNGILTCENRQQAIVRADPMQKDKGGEAAHALLSLLDINGKKK